MPKIIHIIDSTTPVDMLCQLSSIISPDDGVVSLGPAPSAGDWLTSVKNIHVTLGIKSIASVALAREVYQADVLHAWSLNVTRNALAVAEKDAIEVVLSLPYCPKKKDLRKTLSYVERGCALTTPTDSLRKMLIRAGADENLVHVLPPVAEVPDDMDERRLRTRCAMGLDDGHILLATPAEMVRDAGHKYASWAHGILRQMYDEFRLVLPGGGEHEKHVRFFAATTGYDSEVFFTGRKFDNWDILAASDIMLFFAGKNVGVTLLARAAAAGKPIAASNLSDTREIVQDSQSAILIPPNNPRMATSAVMKIFRDKSLAKQLSTKAKNRADKLFNRNAVLQKLEKIYASTMMSRAQRMKI